MGNFWILILVPFFATISLDNNESVQLEELEELPLQTFDELFVDGWWDKDEAAEDLKRPAPANFGQNVHHQIDRQNTQIGQIEPNSTDQLGQIEPNSTDQLGQIEPNSTDKLGQIEPNSTDQIAEYERKHKIVSKFHAIKEEFKKKGKYSKKVWTKIDKKIAKHLKVSRSKIYQWKKEFGLSRKPGPNYSDDEKLKIVKKLMQIKSDNYGEDKKSCKEIDKEIAESFGVNVRTINQWKKEFCLSRRRHSKNARKILVEKFDQKKAELKRAGFKNSYNHEIDESVAKELGLNFLTLYKWKRELGQTRPNKYPHSKQKEF